MKKLLYIALIAFSSSIVFSACTEEEIAPTVLNESTTSNGGGSPTGPL